MFQIGSRRNVFCSLSINNQDIAEKEFSEVMGYGPPGQPAQAWDEKQR